ncbi:hypothetical protein [Streptomyces mirabilis]|uniref:hypothetical protein n=1 Tax=Streptomyces mirabilis TaxID=68239 RepID=UPI0033CD29E3
MGLIAAVANRHTAFQRFPFPDGSLYRDNQAQQPAAPHARLDSCATSYLANLGHVDAPTQDALAETILRIESLIRPGYAPLNGHLLVWLRFANLVAYAAAAPLGH